MSTLARAGRIAIVAGALAALLAGGWWLYRAGPGGAEGQGDALLPPRELDGQPLVQLQRGEEAVRAINRLHRTAIEIVDGYVATYGRGHGQIVVWRAKATSETKAHELVNAMTEKMATSSIFSQPRPVTVGGRLLYFTAGAGMRNYYWASGRDVFWVGIVSAREEQVIEALLSHR